jgi:hypothetical protein
MRWRFPTRRSPTPPRLFKQKIGAKIQSDLIRIAVERGLDWRPL